MHAVIDFRNEDVELLLQMGFTALMKALFAIRVEVVKMLLAHPEMDVNVRDHVRSFVE